MTRPWLNKRIEEINTKINQAMEDKHLSRQDLAFLIAMEPETLSDCLNGTVQWRLDDLIDVCILLGIEITISI